MLIIIYILCPFARLPTYLYYDDYQLDILYVLLYIIILFIHNNNTLIYDIIHYEEYSNMNTLSYS